MAERVSIKDPNAVLDYSMIWTTWLASGETIVTSTWVVPAGLAMDSESNDTVSTTIWLSGGTREKDYVVTNRITTSAGRTDDRSLTIQCRNR